MPDCRQTRRSRPAPEPAEAKAAIPIYKVRDVDVVLDADLARLYGIETKRLNEQIKRNAERFDGDFAFQPTKEDAEVLRSQIATANEEQGRGGRRSLPWIFTEHGVVMAASVVNSPRAIEALRLAKPGLENTELAARAAKLLAEAEAIAFSTIVKTLRLLLEAKKAMRAESPDAFLAVLADDHTTSEPRHPGCRRPPPLSLARANAALFTHGFRASERLTRPDLFRMRKT